MAEYRAQSRKVPFSVDQGDKTCGEARLAGKGHLWTDTHQEDRPYGCVPDETIKKIAIHIH